MTLTRRRIADGVLAVIERTGLEGLTLRGLGDELGTDPMAVYHYVPNKAALMALAARRLLEDLPPAPIGPPWSEALRHFAHACRALAQRNPRTFPLLLDPEPVLARDPGVKEGVLAAVVEGGLPAMAAAPVFPVVVSFVCGYLRAELAELEPARPEDAQPGAVEVPNATSTPDPARYPHLAELSPFARPYRSDACFDTSLEMVLTGLRLRLSPAEQ